MKTFFDGVFISKEKLSQAGIEYPIKLEYYKTLGEENVEAKFGIEVVKTEFFNGNVRVETKELKSITDNEEEQNRLLSILRKWIKNAILKIKEV